MSATLPPDPPSRKSEEEEDEKLGGEEERDLRAERNPRFLEAPLSRADAARCAQGVILHPSLRESRSVSLFWESEGFFTATVKVMVGVAAVADGAIVRTHRSSLV